MDKFNIINGDCIEVMHTIGDNTVDLILCDPPYGTTSCAWDNIIPFSEMWEQTNRILKKNSAIILFGSQPFTSMCINSNINNFKHEIIWLKNVPTGMAQANYAPMKYHENILVFSSGGKINTFNKQYQEREGVGKDCYRYEHYCGDNNHVKMEKVKKLYDSELVNPSSVVLFNTVPNRKGKLHPTQKPVNLLKYLIKQYSNENDVVLDFTMGVGSTGVAALQTNRKFIGIEKDENFFNIAKTRLNNELV